jgi:hypothetical protein
MARKAYPFITFLLGGLKMCNPAAIGMGAQAFGGIMSARNYEAQGDMQSNYYKYLAKQKENEAGLTLTTAEKNVTAIQDAATQQKKDWAQGLAKTEGAQRVAMAASGVTGVTAEDLIKDTFDRAKMDELAIQYNADMRSWEARQGAQMQALDLRSKANEFSLSATNAKFAGRLNAQASLLGGAGNVANTWAKTA